MKRSTHQIKLTLLLCLFWHITFGQQTEEAISPNGDYLRTIQSQQWLLAVAAFVILLLLLLLYNIFKLNRRLKQNEHDQRELNQRIMAVMNNTASSIISLDEKGEIRLINQSATRFFRKWINVELRPGNKLPDAITDEHAHNIWKSWIAKSKTTDSWKEVSQVKVKGKTRYWLENFSKITKTGGEYSGLVQVANDITSEYEMNVEMAERHEDLSKTNQAKERMLSILAHDLKDGIYSAHTMSQLVMESPEDFARDDLLHLFTLFNKNFAKTQDLLNSLLTWIKTQTGALQAKPELFSVPEATDEVIESCEERRRKKGVEIENLIPQGTVVKADREMIKTILRNLLSNALKYSEKGKGHIKFFTEFVNGCIAVHVVDNGTGIPKDKQRKLFEAPGHYTRPGTANEQGTGFGISLCSELLKLNNSKLLLDSEEGKGCDFYFSLPLVQKPQSIETENSAS